MVLPYLVFPNPVLPCPGYPPVLHAGFIDRIFGVRDAALIVPKPMPHDIPCLLQLLERAADAVNAFLADGGKSPRGIIPVIRERKYQGQQPLCFERQPLILQVMVGHDGVVMRLVYSKNGHGLCLLR